MEVSFAPSLHRPAKRGVSPSSLGLASSGRGVSGDMEMSRALPWMQCPQILKRNGRSIAGNAGFDPLGLAQDDATLGRYRESEIKHGRVAMVAAVGWPVAEMYDDSIAKAMGLPSIIEMNNGMNPSLLNGGLASEVNPLFWMAIVAATAIIGACMCFAWSVFLGPALAWHLPRLCISAHHSLRTFNFSARCHSFGCSGFLQSRWAPICVASPQ